jgi:putative MFS transporter
MASALGIGAFGIVFGFARAEWLIILAGFCTTSISNVFSNGFHIYQAEIFPTRIRSTATGIAYSLSRASGAILPFITVTVLDGLGATAVFLGCAVIMMIVALDVGILGPRSTGLNLEDASGDVTATGESVTATDDERRTRSGRFARTSTPARTDEEVRMGG